MIHPSIRRSCIRRCALALSLTLTSAAGSSAARAQGAADSATPAPLVSPTPEPSPSPSPAAKPSPAPESRSQRTAAGGTLSGADVKTLSEYHLTMDRINLYGAVTKQLGALSKTDPEIKKERAAAGAISRDASIEEKVTGFSEKCPHITAAITGVKTADGSAYTVRDYLLTGYSLTNAMTAANARRVSPGWTRPEYIPADNVEIAERNQTMLETMLSGLVHSSRQ